MKYNIRINTFLYKMFEKRNNRVINILSLYKAGIENNNMLNLLDMGTDNTVDNYLIVKQSLNK